MSYKVLALVFVVFTIDYQLIVCHGTDDVWLIVVLTDIGDNIAYTLLIFVRSMKYLGRHITSGEIDTSSME